MPDTKTSVLLSFELGLQSLLQAIKANHQVVMVPLSQALNRVSAHNIAAKISLPAFDNSAMDGFALRACDANQAPLAIQGEALAGKPYQEKLKPQHCIRIATGAVVPQGCDTVIPYEQTLESAKGISFKKAPESQQNIRHAGEDVIEGDTIIHQGSRIKAADIALLAATGHAQVAVIKKTKVGIVSTGDELRQPNETLAVGQLYDANRPALIALLSLLDVEITDFGTLADNRDVLKTTLLAADAQCDFVISTAGVSVGQADHVRSVLAEIGHIEFWRLAIKPGKPFAFGQLANSYYLGLPGNPISAMVTFHLLAAPAIRKHQGLAEQPLKQLKAIIQQDLNKKPGRMDFQRGYWQQDDTGITVKLSQAQQGSHVLSSFKGANCYIALEAERGPIKAGEVVTLWLFDALLS